MIKFLVACALVEEKAAQIYQAMGTAAQAANDESLASLWRNMALDEEDHASQLRLAARLSRERVFEKLPTRGHEDPVVLLERADVLLKHIQSTPLSEIDMLRVAVELEKRFIKLHTSYTILFQELSTQKMFEALAKAEDSHLAGLRARIKKVSAG